MTQTTLFVRSAVAAIALAALAAPAASAQDWATTLAANRCAFMGEKKAGNIINSTFNATDLGKQLGPVDVGGLFEQAIPESPICAARSLEERLVLTGLMMDRAALSAASGVDAAQEALGVKRTLEARRAELEQAVNGLGTGGSDSTQATISEVSDSTDELVAMIRQLEADNSLDDNARQKLASAKVHLNEVLYYAAGAVAGARVVNDHLNRIKKSPNTAFAQLNNSRLGLGSNFAAKLLPRAAGLQPTAENSIKLVNTINSVTRKSEKPQKGLDRAEKQAKKDAERVQQALSGFSLTQAG